MLKECKCPYLERSAIECGSNAVTSGKGTEPQKNAQKLKSELMNEMIETSDV